MRDLVSHLALAVLLVLSGCAGFPGVGAGPATTTTLAAEDVTNSTAMQNGTLVVSRASPASYMYEVNCPSVGVDAVWDRLKQSSEPMGGVSVGIRTENDTSTLHVTRRTLYDRAGDVISRSSITHRRLAALAPGRVRVTVAANGRVDRCQMPVVVRNVSFQQQ